MNYLQPATCNLLTLTMKPETHIFSDSIQLGEAAAQRVAQIAQEATEQHGRFTVAFSGGSLPAILCPALVREPLRSQIGWSAWHVAWADERFVPLSDAESNYRLVREQLFDQVPIPSNQIFVINESLATVESAAVAYQAQLAGLFHSVPGQVPHFDLILLGMGPDGHVASLFPNHPLLQESERWIAPVSDSPKAPPQRITFTLPLLNAARHLLFIVTGSNKAEKVQTALNHAPNPETPASLVQPLEGEVCWFLDEAAGQQL